MAINEVLKHYEGHIITLSTRMMYDETSFISVLMKRCAEGLKQN